jgi:cytochrome c oxidase assembly protein subunit 15
MVKSGLVNDVTVSHYRLSVHLSMAFLIISTIFWLMLNVMFKKNKNFFNLSSTNYPFQILIFLIFFQIIIGAFVSGLDAGKVYQTWPLMGNSYFPDDYLIASFKNIFEFDNHSLVQFYHRNLAYIIIIYVFLLTVLIYKKKMEYLYKPIKIFLFFLLLQAILGIFTLVSGLNIYLASTHQITSVLLVFSALNLYYFKTK